MQTSASAQQHTGFHYPSQRAASSVVLFAKALTASDCCTSVSKGGRITIPRVAVEQNLPVVADKKHHEVVALDVNGTQWNFVIKSWPNGGENKRVYVMEKTAPYMRRNKLKIGDVIAITRRPDAQLGVEHNSEAALHAVSQGRGRAQPGCGSMSAAEAIAAQRCLRNPACSKPLGHAGFCDSGKPGGPLRQNSLAGLAAAAEQASNSSAGHGEGHMSPKVRMLAADRPPSSQSPQGMLVGKVLTRSDVEQCRIVLPRLAMEANMPEVVDADILHVEVMDEEGAAWPVTLSMSSSGIAKRMFMLERIGAFIRQHNLKTGDCIAIKREHDDLLHIVINPDNRDLAATTSGREEGAPSNGVSVDSAESVDVARRQSVRRRRFKSGCEVNFARMLCGSLKSNGLADPFKNNEDDTFPEEQLPPPLQDHDATSSAFPPRRSHQEHAGPSGGHHPLGLHNHTSAFQHHPRNGAFPPLHYPSFLDLYPAHAAAAGHAFPANFLAGNGNASRSSNHHQTAARSSAVSGSANGLADPASVVHGPASEQSADLPPPKLLSNTAAAAHSSDKAPVNATAPASSTLHQDSQPAGPSSLPGAAPAAAASNGQTAGMAGVSAALAANSQGANPYMMALQMSAALGGMQGSLQCPYFGPSGSVPSLFQTSAAPAVMPVSGAASAAPSQPVGVMPSLPSGSFPFPPAVSAADLFPPNLYYGAAADAARLYAQHMAPFANASAPGSNPLSPLLPTPFAASGLQTPSTEEGNAAAAGTSRQNESAAAGKGGKKRKTPGSAQKRAGKSSAGQSDGSGAVIAKRATNRPPPQVPHGSLGKGSGTPRNLARSHVLVAKALTNSDTHGRIIMPRVSVEANLTFLVGFRSYSLPVKDEAGRRWEFVIKSWANGTENRRVYVLEQTSEYLKVNRLGVGDAVGICTDEEGELVVASNTPSVRQATVRPTYGAAAVHHMPTPPPGKAETFTNGTPGRCNRSPCCTKFAGHSGFCSGPRALADSPTGAGPSSGAGGSGRFKQEQHDQPTDQLQRRPSAAAAQEEEEDMSAAEEVASEAMAVGSLVITHLTPQDLRAAEVLLPKQAVEANILPALSYALLKFKVVDDGGSEHEVLLRSFVGAGQETMYLLDRLGPVLEQAGAQAGDMLMLTRDEGCPVRVHLESIKYNHKAAGRVGRHSPYTSTANGQELPSDYEHQQAQFGSALVCGRTSGCTKSAGHQGFCSGHKGFRRRFLDDAHAHSGEWDDSGSGSESGQEDTGDDEPTCHPPSYPNRLGMGKRKAYFQDARPAKRASFREEVRVMCGNSSGAYDIRRGCIALRAAQHGQIVNLELTPAEFEERVLGVRQDWRQSLLVEVGEQDQAGLQQALPLGQWLQQHSMAVDEQGRLLQPQASRFAREAGAASHHPCLSGPDRGGKAHRPPQPTELARSGRARSLPTRVKPPTHAHNLARFASKPVPRAFVPKRARSRTGGMGGRAEPPTSQDSLAAEVLLSLCPSGFREMGSDVGDGVVDSAAPLVTADSAQDMHCDNAAVPPHSAPDEVKPSCQTERMLSIPLIDSRGYGGMATMDPAGSAVLDQIFGGNGGHVLEAMGTS